MRTNRTIRKRVLGKIAATWANTQEEQADEVDENTMVITDKQLEYSRFMKTYYPGLGVQRTAELIKRASSITQSEVMEHWATVMDSWRYSKDTTRPGPLHGVDHTLYTLSHNERGHRDQLEEAIAQWQHLCDATIDAQGKVVMGVIKLRWSLATLYREAERLKARILQEEGTHTGVRGCDMTTVALDRLFARQYGSSTRRAEDPTSKKRAQQLKNLLKRGKRWWMLEEGFGIGIFAMLSPSLIPNTFIERTLPEDQLAIWIKLVGHCDPSAQTLCDRVKPLLLSYIKGEGPPAYRLGAERVLDWEASSTSNPVLLLDETVGDSDIEDEDIELN